MSTATMPASNPFAGTASTGGGGDYNLIVPDNYPGHLIAIVDLGTHDDEYMSEAKPDQRSLCLAWELSGEGDGTPPVISEVYTVWVRDGVFQFGDKNKLRKMLEGWRGSSYGPGDPIDPMKFLGKSCLVNVTHKVTQKGKTIHVVGNISKLPKGMTAANRHFEPIAFHVSMGSPPNLDHLPFIYAGTPKGMQAVADVIAQSKERKGRPIGNGRPATTPYSEPIVPGSDESQAMDDDEMPDF